MKDIDKSSKFNNPCTFYIREKEPYYITLMLIFILNIVEFRKDIKKDNYINDIIDILRNFSSLKNNQKNKNIN
jgi:hypothetical protein